MSNLSDLYISASYYGVVNLSDSSEPFVSQSEAQIYLHDGLGENLGIWFNSQKRVHIDNGLTVTGSTVLSSSLEVTGSISVEGTISSSTHIYAPSASFDTINARMIHTTIESSSVIYSSGSNQIGDETSDVQTIIGQTSISGSLTVIGNHSHTGDQSITGSLFVSNEISSSTIAGLGNAFNFSQSVDSRLDYLEGPFSTSVDFRLDSLEQFSSSLQVDFVTDAELAYTVGLITGSFIQADANLQSQINTLNDQTSSYAYRNQQNTFSQQQTINNDLYVNANSVIGFNSTLFSVNGRSSFTGSVDITGSLEHSGSMEISGSVNGNVTELQIVSSTASLDCNEGNFFKLQLVSGSTHLTATNIKPGMTITLELTQPAGDFGNVTYDSTLRFPLGLNYLPSNTNNAIDVISFVSFDTQKLLGTALNQFE